MKTVVIGGGPSGMMAAISAASKGDNVVILEKENSLGRKLLITGKGRCNITSSLPMSEFIKNIQGNGKFLYSCFEEFTNQDIIDFLKKNNLNVKNERGNRIFPVTDNAQSVLDCFIEELKENKVKNTGIFHCCPLNNELIKDGLNLDFYISFSGVITFKNAKPDECIKLVPNDRILIETDSPYLSPEPHRGETNTSINVKFVAQKIAEVKNTTLEEIAQITKENAKRIFEIA